MIDNLPVPLDDRAEWSAYDRIFYCKTVLCSTPMSSKKLLMLLTQGIVGIVPSRHVLKVLHLVLRSQLQMAQLHVPYSFVTPSSSTVCYNALKRRTY